MSKKKAFSGSTMTLKDFHGGSIPSDIPLPSAPGVVVRNFDRPGLDRGGPAAWGSPINRSDHRRPGSAGASRNFDEKASFFSHPVHIGRNFDEDERKPLDSGPRRNSIDDDGLPTARSDRFVLNRLDPRLPEAKTSVRPQISGAQALNTAASVVSARPSSGSGNPSGVPNAWGVRQELGFYEERTQAPVPPAQSASAASRLASASAIEKVSSGIWQSKLVISSHQSQSSIYQPEFETRAAEFEGNGSFKNTSYNEITSSQPRPFKDEIAPALDANQVDSRRYHETRRYDEDVVRPRDVECGDYEKERSRMARPVSAEGKLDIQPQSEFEERPKLKLLPRTRPMEPQDSYINEYRLPTNSSVQVHDEVVVNVNHPPTSGSAVPDESNRVGERPRLNLKPRSQALEQSDGITERGRKTIFGGARPRELVLKERGVDDEIINSLDPVHPPSRGKHDLQRSDAKTDSVTQHHRLADRADNAMTEQRTGHRTVERADIQSDRRDFERKDNREQEKIDLQRSSRRSDNWRNGRDIEKQQDRHEEPESWRKPERNKSPEPPAPRYGRAASAVELVQAFSRSVSVSGKTDHAMPNVRSLPSKLVDSGALSGRSPVPFSRLTDAREVYPGSAQRHINGY
ncbi:uncharacterized protein LOC116260217 [Nymphaea colorata]|nr:uncharacterized protein LOC116260217 [Nymphaea colorata]